MNPARLGINIAMGVDPETGRRYKQRDVNRAQDEIAWVVKLDPPTWVADPPQLAYWRVWICFRFPNHMSDVDGPIKRTLDALQVGLRAADIPFDDRDVVDLRAQKSVGKDNPHIIINLEAL